MQQMGPFGEPYSLNEQQASILVTSVTLTHLTPNVHAVVTEAVYDPLSLIGMLAMPPCYKQMARLKLWCNVRDSGGLLKLCGCL